MGTFRLRRDGALIRGELELDGARYPFAAERPMFGRDATCEIRLPVYGHAIARKHVQFELHHGSICIRDLQSAQGIFINREHKASDTPWPLHDGDTVHIGTETFLIRLE